MATNPLRDMFLRNPSTSDHQFNRRKLIFFTIMGSENPLLLINRMKTEFCTLMQNNCLKLAEEPVIDVLYSILSANQEPRSNIGSKINEYPSVKIVKDVLLPKDLIFRAATIENIKFQPMILTAQQMSITPSSQKFVIEYDEGISGDEEFSDDHSVMYRIGKKMNRLGLAMRNLLHSEIVKLPEAVDTTAQQDPVASSSSSLGNVNSESSLVQKNSIESTDKYDSYDGDTESLSSSDSGDTRSDDEFVTPLHIVPKRQKLSAQSSSSESESEIDSIAEACKKATNISFINFYRFAGREIISSDELHLDVFIVCTDVNICRFLSATFGLISLDDIAVQLSDSKKSKCKISYADVFSINNAWIKLTEKPLEGHRRTLQYVQTRISESLACGAHNIGITCLEWLRNYVHANVYALMRFDIMPPAGKYNFIFESINFVGNKFLESCVALTQIVNLALSYDVSVPCVVKMKGEYFNMNMSLISIIPFYALRSICEEDISRFITARRNQRAPCCESFFPSLEK